MKLHSGICQHCGEKKEVHTYYCRAFNNMIQRPTNFEDSGLARLHENAEELFEACEAFRCADRQEHLGVRLNDQEIQAVRKIFDTLDKITDK